ncbi:MAG: CysS/YqeB C-terminal domain-containing protein, partial [Acidimicrobiales bacterium]
SAVREMASAVGLDLQGAVDVPPDIAALVQQRQDARAARDYAAADRIRAELAARGWTVEDTPEGPRAHPNP